MFFREQCQVDVFFIFPSWLSRLEGVFPPAGSPYIFTRCCSKASKIIEQNHTIAKFNMEGKKEGLVNHSLMFLFHLVNSYGFCQVLFLFMHFIMFVARTWVSCVLCYSSVNAHSMDVAKARWWNSNIFAFTVWGRYVGLKSPSSRRS